MWRPGQVNWLHGTADAAVIAVDGLGAGLPPVRWGRIEGSEPLHWTATGFPSAGLEEHARVEEEAYGRVAPGSRESVGGLALTVESREAEDEPGGGSGWAGLSGAAVLSGDLLIGIVTSDPQRWGAGLDGVRSVRLLDGPGPRPPRPPRRQRRFR